MRFDNLQALENLSKGDSLFLFADGATTMANPISNEYVEYVKTVIGIFTNVLFQIRPKLGQVDFPNLATLSEINVGLTAENFSVAPEAFGKLLISINLNPNAKMRRVVKIRIAVSLKKLEYTPFLKPQAKASSQ
jgi:hypothetical protein